VPQMRIGNTAPSVRYDGAKKSVAGAASE
jgi:hypothetical protein